MPRKQNKWTHNTVLLCRMAKAEKKVRVNDHEDMLCEPKVVGASRKKEKKTQIYGSCRSCCRWNGTILDYCWIIAHVFQLTCLPTDVLCLTCGETGLYISVCEGLDQRAWFASKLALTCDLCEYKKFEMSSPRTQFSDKNMKSTQEWLCLATKAVLETSDHGVGNTSTRWWWLCAIVFC